MRSSSSLLSPDKHLEHWIAGHRVEWLNWFFLGLSRIGTLGVVWIAIAFVLAFLWRRPAVPLYVIAAVAAADILAKVGKIFVHRHRPFEHQIGPSERTHSWPSGHASTAFAGAATMAWLVPRFRVLWYALAVLIAYSRLYNGVHYPTDVVSGAILGLVVAWVVRRVRFTR